MRKLIRGVVGYHERVRPLYRRRFARLALGQKPDALLVACSDSRVAPNIFASEEPGDLFVVRNVGNLIPRYAGRGGKPCHAEGAALEFAALALRVKDIIVCGHSSCGAMRALLEGPPVKSAAHLEGWLSHAGPVVRRFEAGSRLDAAIPRVDRLSQFNVLQQIEHIRSYPAIERLVRAGRLRLHAWWFDIAAAEVLHFEPRQGRFVVIDAPEAARLLRRFGP
ncbi:MAG: carbonic anhydrase [Elusimicrobia bacterium]|nr:carbonic anhydrase [Elusimicrobiota bacterium]